MPCARRARHACPCAGPCSRAWLARSLVVFLVDAKPRDMIARHRALRQTGKARMSLRRSVLAGMAGEKPRRPQFMGVAQVLRFPACQRHQPSPGFERDRRFPTGTRAIVERGHRAFDHGALDAKLDCLMVKSQRPTNRKKRRILPIGQQYSRPLDPPCRFGSRLRYRIQLGRILISRRSSFQRTLNLIGAKKVIISLPSKRTS
jgi:hypothetical protein